MSSERPTPLSRRQFLRLLSMAAGAGASSVVLQACGGASTPATTGPTSAPATSAPATVPAGARGQVIFGNAEPPTSAQWDDQTVFGLADFQVASLVQDRLWEADESGKLIPRLATEWSYKDEKTLEITLREGVKYHDGETFTAEDVKAVLDRVSNDSKLAHNLFWAPVQTEVVSTYKVRIGSDPAFGPLVPVLAGTNMLPKAWVAAPDKFKSGGNGVGPYRFVEYRDNRVVLEANEGYWDGSPGVKTVIFDYIEDANARLNALLAGDVDIITRCSSQQLDAVKGNDNFYVVENSPAISVVLLYTRDKNPAMQSEELRQAMWYAIDRKTILEKIMFGVGKYADSIIPTSALFYEPLAEAYAYDPTKAKELLQQSGLGSSVRLSMATSNLVPNQKEIDQAIVSYLNDVGIQVDVTTLEVGQFRTDWPQYDISLNTNGTPNGDPDFLLNFYAGEGVLGAAKAPRGEEIVRLHQEQRSKTDTAQRQQAVTAACNWLWDFQNCGVLSDELWPFITNKRVKGYKRQRSFGEPLFRYATVES